MENKTKKRQFVIAGLLLCAVALAGMAQVGAQSPSPYGSGQAGGNGQSLPEVIEAIEKARVVTRILYVTAHPDDEPGAVLAYLARGLHADVALLSLTRGEGGQNALGPEQAPQLGVLRTEELMNATRVYGTRLFFTRAADFGYTKTPEEAMKVWGDQVLEDMVRVIRTFRPHVIINSWGGVRGGHGQHVASGLLTPQAYAMAADAKAFPKLADEGLQPWKAEALLQLSRGDASGGFSIPVSEISPLWGKSWGEIGIEGYLNHRTQGVGGVRSSPFFRRALTLVAVEGAKPDAALLATPLSAFGRLFPGTEQALLPWAKKMDESLVQAETAARALQWDATTQNLARAAHDLEATPLNAAGQKSEAAEELIWETRKIMKRMENAIVAAAALQIEAAADRSEVVAGESFSVTVTWRKRSDAQVEIEGASLALPEGWSVTKEEKLLTGGLRFTVEIPKPNADEHRLGKEEDNAETQRAQKNTEKGEWIYPWAATLVKARLKARVGEHEFEAETEVTATRVTSVSADTRPIELVPAVTLTVEPKSFVVVEKKSAKSVELLLRAHYYGKEAVEIAVGVAVPPMFAQELSPVFRIMKFEGPGDQLARFVVTPPPRAINGTYELKAWAKMREQLFDMSVEPLPTLPTRMWSEPAVARVHVMDVTVPKDLRVGYVAAENDRIPQALLEIGVRVELLDEAALAFEDLSKYDAIAIGIRAYELRSDLARANQRLLDYAAAGGTLVVQYQREGVWNQLKPAPYAATASSQRTTDENSPVRILDPAQPLLTFPNAIRAEDFSGWVQERGLYYWDKFDAKYTPVLALRDPGEAEALGALVYARHGKGVYIYTGLSFFRQLPEGVPGAYRLFVNLLSQGKRKIE